MIEINCVYGTSNKKNCILAETRLASSGASRNFKIVPVGDNHSKKIQVGDNLIVVKTYVSMSQASITKPVELLLNYGTRYWDYYDSFCMICLGKHPSRSNPMVLCDGLTANHSPCKRAIHIQCT